MAMKPDIPAFALGALLLLGAIYGYYSATGKFGAFMSVVIGFGLGTGAIVGALKVSKDPADNKIIKGAAAGAGGLYALKFLIWRQKLSLVLAAAGIGVFAKIMMKKGAPRPGGGPGGGRGF